MSVEKYPVLSSHYSLVRQDGDSWIYANFDKSDNAVVRSQIEYETMNKSAAEILSLCDGTHTVSGIIESLRNIYGDDLDSISENVLEFLERSIQSNHIYLADNPTVSQTRIYGDFSLVTPVSGIIEITKQCPLKCEHCFNNSGKASSEEMSFGEIIEVLDTLKNMGVQKIMITGGEPSSRPDYIDILLHALDRFASVVLATNGYLVKDQDIEAMGKNSSNLVVQVSLDGKEAAHDHVRGVAGSFKRASDVIRKLSAKGVIVAVSTTVNDGNYPDLELLPEYIMGLGAVQLTIAPTVEQGRAQNKNLLDKVSFEDVFKIQGELSRKYSGKGLYISFVEDMPTGQVAEKNDYCGAGVSQVTIRSNGDVVPCVSYDYPYGNILTDKLSQIFSKQNVDLFESLPSPCTDICGSCQHLEGKCSGCNARALDTSVYAMDCSWKPLFEQHMKGITA